MVASRATTPMPPGTRTCPASRTSASRTDAPPLGERRSPASPEGIRPDPSIHLNNRGPELTQMSAVAAPRLHRHRLRRIRPILIVAASLDIVCGSYVANGQRPTPAPAPVAQPAAGDPPALTGPG